LNNRVNGVLAVTRALGDVYMKDLVTGHPYTTETVIQADLDEFIILACDGVSPSPYPLTREEAMLI
jgi:protein phosphatase PTC1